MNSYLTTLRRQLTAVARDLDNLAPAQAGTEWHRDRVDEARWLVSEIERVERMVRS